MENQIKALVSQATQEINSHKTQSRQWPHLQPKAEALKMSHSKFMGDENAFCEVFSPTLQKKVAENEERAFLGKAPMLCTLDAAYGEGSALLWLIPQLHDLCATVGVKTKLDDMQLKQLAQMIRSEFGYLKATEVMLFLWRLKGGHYGEFYGSVDIQRVMRALRGRFSEERAKVIDHHEGEQRDQERQQWSKTALKPHEVEELRKRLEEEGKI